MKIVSSISTVVLLSMIAGSALAEPKETELERFVHQVHMQGMPYEEAIRFEAAKSVPVLLAMLHNPKEEESWPNVVVMLGILGDERAITPLIEFLEKDSEGKLSRAHYTAKTVVVMALGYSINRHENQKALNYLVAATKPSFWTERKLSWISPYHADAQGRNEQLSKMAILGLALSGHPYARDALLELQRPEASPVDAKFRTRVSPVIEEALKAHETITRDGLVRYYANAHASAR